MDQVGENQSRSHDNKQVFEENGEVRNQHKTKEKKTEIQMMNAYPPGQLRNKQRVLRGPVPPYKAEDNSQDLNQDGQTDGENDKHLNP